MLRIYGAGKMGGRLGLSVLVEREEAFKWCRQYGADFIDPAKGEGIRPDQVVDLRMDYITMKNFVAKDEFAIKHCDVLLVITGDTPSEGTGLEFGLAIQLGIPVVLVSPKRCKGELMGFWNIKADAIFPTTQEAVKFIVNNYKEKKHGY